MIVIKFVLVGCSIFFCFRVNAQNQKNDVSNSDFRINSGKHYENPPLYLLNGMPFTGNLSGLNPDTVGVVFAEGDSSFVSRTYGDSPDTSLIRQYFGEQRNRGIFFIFSKDKVQTVSKKEFFQSIKDERCKVVFKVNDDPLTSKYAELDFDRIDQIQMVKDFKLWKWNTGEEDVFTLFVIKAKRQQK